MQVQRMEHQAITHYSAPTKIVHWLTAILVLVAFIYGPGGSEERVYSSARDFDRQLHETLGLCVFALVVFRILWRTIDKRPEPPPVARWMSVTAGIVKMALYILLFALPLGATIAELHTWLGDIIIWLAGAHALAGLFHHYVLKDGVLRSMLPRRNADIP